MAARFKVFCKRSVAGVTPEQLLAGTRMVDLHTIAENDNVPEDIIVTALRQLRIENVDAAGFRWYRLCYRPSEMRQIDVERWQTRDEVRAVCAEQLEKLEAEGHTALSRIRGHLGETVDIVSASFGSSAGEQMASILASEVVRWLAEQFAGIIQAPDGSWWELGPEYYEYQPLRS